MLAAASPALHYLQMNLWILMRSAALSQIEKVPFKPKRSSRLSMTCINENVQVLKRECRGTERVVELIETHSSFGPSLLKT